MQPGQGRGVWPGQVSWCCPRTPQCSLTSRPLGAAEKPGACPAAAPEGLTAPCSFPCLEDKDCLGAQKCCPLGCGSACLEPAQGKDAVGMAGSLAHPGDPVCHSCLTDALAPGRAAPDSCRKT